jgi:hypothetical protein
MEVREGRAIVQVMLQGRGPYQLAVETGSPSTLVSPAVAQALGLARAEDPAIEEQPAYRLDSLSVGTMVVRGLTIGTFELADMLQVDGVLGLDASADLQLTIDYPGSRLTLSRDTLPAADGQDVLQAIRVGPFVGIPVDLAGVVETGVIDTQGGMMFQALPEVAERLTFERPPAVVGRARVGGGAPVELREGRLAGDVTIGRQVFTHPRIAVHPLPPDIPSRVTIGIDALTAFVLTMDQRTMRVRLRR